jgi:hypothetical protein
MAKELAKLHRQRTQEEADRNANDRGHVMLQSLIEAQAKKNEEEKREIRELKEQLEHLRIHEQEAPKSGAISAPDINSAVRHEENICHSHHAPSNSHRMRSVAVGDEEPGYGSRGLNDASQVDGFEKDIGKQDFHLNGEGKTGFDDWLSAELSMEDMLNGKSIILGVDDKLEEDIDTSHIRASSISDEILLAQHSDLNQADERKEFDSSFYGLQLSEFQNAEIRRLKKQRFDLLQTGVYGEDDRIIKGLSEEIRRLETVDTMKFGF